MAVWESAAIARSSKRHGVALQALEVVEGPKVTVVGHRTRCRSSFGNQRSNSADDVRVDLPGLRLAVGHGKPDLGGGEAG